MKKQDVGRTPARLRQLKLWSLVAAVGFLALGVVVVGSHSDAGEHVSLESLREAGQLGTGPSDCVFSEGTEILMDAVLSKTWFELKTVTPSRSQPVALPELAKERKAPADVLDGLSERFYGLGAQQLVSLENAEIAYPSSLGIPLQSQKPAAVALPIEIYQWAQTMADGQNRLLVPVWGTGSPEYLADIVRSDLVVAVNDNGIEMSPSCRAESLLLEIGAITKRDSSAGDFELLERGITSPRGFADLRPDTSTTVDEVWASRSIRERSTFDVESMPEAVLKRLIDVEISIELGTFEANRTDLLICLQQTSTRIGCLAPSALFDSDTGKRLPGPDLDVSVLSDEPLDIVLSPLPDDGVDRSSTDLLLYSWLRERSIARIEATDLSSNDLFKVTIESGAEDLLTRLRNEEPARSEKNDPLGPVIRGAASAQAER